MSVRIPVNVRLFASALWRIYTRYPVIMFESIDVDFFVLIIHISHYKNIFSVTLFAMPALMFLRCYNLAPIIPQVSSARYSLFAKNTISCPRYI